MKPRFIFFIITIFCAVLIIVAAAASSAPNPKSTAKGQVTCTVNGEVGVAQAKITNMNTGNSITIVGANLPYSFVCSKDDSIRISITTEADYSFNAWIFNTKTFDSHNPITIKMTADTTVTANLLYVEYK